MLQLRQKRWKFMYFLERVILIIFMKMMGQVLCMKMARPVEGKSGIIPAVRDYRIRFRNTREADDVKVYLDKDLISSESYVEDEDFIVVVKDVRTTSQLTINCKGKDIEIDAVRILNEDIDSIISDLQIETRLKEEIASIMYSDLDIKKKRIQIKKLKSKGLEPLFIRMFMKLLELFSEL